MRLPSPSPEATRAAARALARAVADDPRGLVVALEGPLGAGKTAFVQGLAEGLGIDPRAVASPTFVIASEYESPDGVRLAHVDLYRVGSAAELETAGFLDLLEPGTIVAVEWADRLPGALPADRLEVRIERPAAGAGRPEVGAVSSRRVLHAKGLGTVGEAALTRWREVLARAPGSPPIDPA